MRIALVTTLAGGGPVEHTLVLARGLSEAGVQVRAVCSTPALAARFAAAGAEPVVVQLRGSGDLSRALALRRAAFRADVVHAQDRRAGLWMRILPRAAATGLVYTVHGLPDPYLPVPVGPRRPGLRATFAYRGLDAALTRRADAVVTPSATMARILVDRVGYPSSSLTVVPNGVAVGGPQSFGDAVGTLSVLEPVKGLDVFLDAAARLARDRPSLPLVVFGAGSQETALRQRAQAVGLAGRVDFAGHSPPGAALATLAVLALPSHMENCPMAMLEAMAAGVPVVASRVGGIPEMAPEGTASLVPVGDAGALAAAISTLLDDAPRRDRQVAAARARVELENSQSTMTGRLLEVYARVRAARRTR